MSVPVKMWRYHLPNDHGEGWAVVHMDSLGFFAAVSDYGNYAYIWGGHGMSDFRLFILNMVSSWDYFGTKLAYDKMHTFHLQHTIEAIRREILEQRRAKRLDRETAKDEWELVSCLDQDLTWDEWVKSQSLFEDWSVASDLAVREPSADIRCFCTKTLPRLVRMIEADLEEEAKLGRVGLGLCPPSS